MRIRITFFDGKVIIWNGLNTKDIRLQRYSVSKLKLRGIINGDHLVYSFNNPVIGN